jgi:dTDP-4-amino-4,6-dideoxy-D-galactose acyltransferase
MSLTAQSASSRSAVQHPDERSPVLTLLQWDSELFGFPVARVEGMVGTRELAAALDDATSSGIVLVYWFVPPGTNVPDELVARYGGKLVDRKVKYAAGVATLPPLGVSWNLKSYRAEIIDDDLRELALQSSAYSRFRLDSRLDPGLVVTLYDAWITRSVHREIADEVLVARENGRAVGLVTLTEKVGRGDIGLLSVDASARGKGLGRALVYAAVSWSRARHHEIAQVVTQLDNRPACALYEACGYAIEHVEHVYHFWLPDRLGTLHGER